MSNSLYIEYQTSEQVITNEAVQKAMHKSTECHLKHFIANLFYAVQNALHKSTRVPPQALNIKFILCSTKGIAQDYTSATTSTL